MTTEDTTEIAKTANERDFALQQRQAQALAASDLVPQAYRNNLPNVLLALEIANRIGASPFGVMQNLHLIQGRPSWSASFLIASINSCGRFKPLRFAMAGKQEDGDSWGCTAWTKAQDSEEVYEGPTITIAIAKAEGWVQKKGSKWQTMPSLMLRYRAAAFFARLYAPELTLGMQSEDEIRDTTGAWDAPAVAAPTEDGAPAPPLDINAGLVEREGNDPGDAHQDQEDPVQ